MLEDEKHLDPSSSSTSFDLEWLMWILAPGLRYKFLRWPILGVFLSCFCSLHVGCLLLSCLYLLGRFHVKPYFPGCAGKSEWVSLQSYVCCCLTSFSLVYRVLGSLASQGAKGLWCPLFVYCHFHYWISENFLCYWTDDETFQIHWKMYFNRVPNSESRIRQIWGYVL